MKKANGLLLLTCSLLLCAACVNGQTDNFDVRTVKKIQQNRTAGKTSFFTTMSGSAAPVSAGVPLVLFVKGLIEKDKTEKKQALYMVESAIVSQAITFGMKEIFNRKRPAEHDPSIISLKKTNSASFPSGHTSIAFSTATSISILYPKWYVIVPSYTWASLVGYSRMYLGVHYPTDIIAGAVVGGGSAWLSYKLNKWMHKPKGKSTITPKF
jgi:membrane-associated phospholipid phosphatase